jgi:hypothetical protein
MATKVREGVLREVKGYVFVRWKKRWPIVPLVPFLVASWAMTADAHRVHLLIHRTIAGAVIFIVVVVLFPFRWGSEDWEQPKT